MAFLPDAQSPAPPKKGRRSKKHTPEIAEFESLLKRRQELTMQAHQVQNQLDELRIRMAKIEADAEGAWDQAIDMNSIIRDQLTQLRNNGIDDKLIYELIDRYNAV